MPLWDTDKPVVQLFNVCQGSVDASVYWNADFNRALSLLDVHHSMRDLAVCVHVIDNKLVLF